MNHPINIEHFSQQERNVHATGKAVQGSSYDDIMQAFKQRVLQENQHDLRVLRENRYWYMYPLLMLGLVVVLTIHDLRSGPSTAFTLTLGGVVTALMALNATVSTVVTKREEQHLGSLHARYLNSVKITSFQREGDHFMVSARLPALDPDQLFPAKNRH